MKTRPIKMKRVTLPAGTLIHVEDVPVVLMQDAVISTANRCQVITAARREMRRVMDAFLEMDRP